LRGQKISARGALHVDGDNYRLSDLAVDMGEAHLRAAGVLNDSWNLGWEARADNLATLLPARGTITSEGRVTGPRAAPRMVVTAHVRDLVMEPHRLAPLDADIHLDLQTHARDLEGRLTLTLDHGDRIEGRVRLPGLMARAGVMKGQPIEGELSARLSRLELLPALLPDVEDTRGELRASLALGGTLGDPRITGRVTLADGTAQVPRLGLTLKAIALTAESDGRDRIRFEGRLRSGGELRFNGRMQWPTDNARDWSAELALKGERVEAVKIPEAWVLVSPDLRLRARLRRVDVEGELVVPEARIEPLQTGAAVPVSRDVILVNAPDDLVAGRTPWDLYSQVRVVLGDKVRFNGFGLTGNITGSVTATDEPERITTARGELNVTAGKYQAYGRDLDVERGRLIFAGGPIDNPGIDARAVRRVGEVLAGISVRGTLKSPVLTLFSDPPMPETDILSYLILGQPLQQASTAEGRTLLGAASALTLTGGDRVARDIGARFGFEEVAIQAGSTPGEASLVVGRYLSPKLFVAYSVGLFEQINLLRLRYQLSSRWTVQTETGTYSGADLLFTIER
jgi:translocation and assembly module TamB